MLKNFFKFGKKKKGEEEQKSKLENQLDKEIQESEKEIQKIKKETEKVPELLTEAAFDNKNATVQKIKDIYINTHRSHV